MRTSRTYLRWCTLCIALLLSTTACKRSEHAPDIEDELVVDSIEEHRSEAELPQLQTATKAQRQLFRDAQVALQEGDEAHALDILQKLAESETSSAQRRDGVLLYATLLEAHGKHAEAIAVLEDLIAKIPPSGDVFLVLARLQQAQGALDEAERSLRDATRSAPELLRAWIALAQLLESQNQHDDAEDAMLHYEREVYRIGAQVEHGATLEERLEGIAQLRVALPDPRISRILARALKNDAFDVQSAALDALQHVGTDNAIEAVENYQQNASSSTLKRRAADVLKSIQQRHP